jgi:hypothetical protein
MTTQHQMEEEAFTLAKQKGLKLLPFFFRNERLFFVRSGRTVILGGQSFGVEELLQRLEELKG